MQAIPKKSLDRFILDARAFIAYGAEHGMNNTAILSNLSHDIFGLAIGDKLMLPRVSGYEKLHPFLTSELARHSLVNNGSGLGCLIPILNAQKTGGSKKCSTSR